MSEEAPKKGSAIWMKNISGMTVTDAEMEAISNPRLELAVHIGAKTIQVGAIMGMLAIGPITQLVRGPRSIQVIANTALRFGTNGVIIGAVAGPIVTYAASRKFEYEQFYDRCFRIRHNRGQVITDRMCYFGMVVGAGAGYATGFGILPGLALGVVIGTGGSVFAPGRKPYKDAKKQETKDA